MKQKSYKDIDGLSPKKSPSVKSKATSNPKIRSNIQNKFLNYLAKKGVKVEEEEPKFVRAAMSDGFKAVADDGFMSFGAKGFQNFG